MFGIEQGLNELDHGREHARHVTAGVVLGFGPKTLSSARSARNSVAADPVAVAGYVTAAQCNRDAPDRSANAEKQRPVARAARGRRSLKYDAVYPYELVDGFEAERVLGAWMTFYSDVRPHSAEQAGPQVFRAPVAAALSSPPPDPLPGLAAALRGLTHEAARFPSSSSSMIRYQTDDEGVVSQPEYTLTKPSNGPNDRDHLSPPRPLRASSFLAARRHLLAAVERPLGVANNCCGGAGAGRTTPRPAGPASTSRVAVRASRPACVEWRPDSVPRR